MTHSTTRVRLLVPRPAWLVPLLLLGGVAPATAQTEEPCATMCDTLTPQSTGQPRPEPGDEGEGEGEPASEGEGEPASEGEGEPAHEGEGEGEPASGGEGEPANEGEGEPANEGEGEPASEAEDARAACIAGCRVLQQTLPALVAAQAACVAAAPDGRQAADCLAQHPYPVAEQLCAKAVHECRKGIVAERCTCAAGAQDEQAGEGEGEGDCVCEDVERPEAEVLADCLQDVSRLALRDPVGLQGFADCFVAQTCAELYRTDDGPGAEQERACVLPDTLSGGPKTDGRSVGGEGAGATPDPQDGLAAAPQTDDGSSSCRLGSVAGAPPLPLALGLGLVALLLGAGRRRG